MADSVVVLLAHAEEFTDTERLTLRIWFDLDLAGNDDLADRFLTAGLMLEHFQSLLPHDPVARTADHLVEVQRLTFEFQRLLAEAQQFLMKRGVSKGSGERFVIDSLRPDWRTEKG